MTLFRTVLQKSVSIVDVPVSQDMKTRDPISKIQKDLDKLPWENTGEPPDYVNPEFRKRNQIEFLGEVEDLKRKKKDFDYEEMMRNHPRLPFPEDS